MLNFSQKCKEAFENQSHKNTEQNIFTNVPLELLYFKGEGILFLLKY